MKLFKVKKDKSDAKAICEYATVNEVPLYTARDKNQAECLQLMRLIDIYLKQSTALKNKLHGKLWAIFQNGVSFTKPIFKSCTERNQDPGGSPDRDHERRATKTVDAAKKHSGFGQ